MARKKEKSSSDLSVGDLPDNHKCYNSKMESGMFTGTSRFMLVVLGSALLMGTASAGSQPRNQAPNQAPNQAQDQWRGLDGEWIYVEDRTEGRALAEQGPPMSAKFSLRVEDGAIVLVSGHGSGHNNVRLALDGTVTDVAGATAGTFARYRGAWNAGVFTSRTEFVRAPGAAPDGLIQREFRLTQDGMLVRVLLGSPATSESVGLYRHAEDIAMPMPARARIGDIEWLAGAWVGTRGTAGTTSIEERWSPARGGSMLGVSRTVSREQMTAFEYLRIVERDSGMVYIAQPNGSAPTEFVLTELTATRAVFDNPRHDYPKRIVYELSDGHALNVSIGFISGGSPRPFEFRREGSER